MSFDGVLALTLADTPSEIVDIMKRETKKQEDARQQAEKNAMDQFQAQLQADKADKEAERVMKLELEREKLRSQEARTKIDLDKFRLQNDVDRNNVADTIQKSVIELIAKREIESAKIAAAREKNQEDVRIEELKLGLEVKKSEADIAKARFDADAKLEELSIKRRESDLKREKVGVKKVD
jgi:hypothetical protein